MKTIQLLPSSLCVTLAVLACVIFTAHAHCQTPATGIVSGRVEQASARLSLERARITVVGTNQEVFTDAFGEYRLTAVPAGTATLQAFYTGHVAQTKTVQVTAGASTACDFTLARLDALPTAGETIVQIEQMIVASARDTNADSIAINEQRFAPNSKAVISTDALGIVGENNIGEFVKFLPGVDVVNDQMNAIGISLRGMPQAYSGISIDGETMNVAGSAGPNRATSLQTISLVNASRIEITKVPTPDMPASSLGGSLNLVSRTAFEASRPELRFKVFVNKNSHYGSFGKSPAGGRGDDQKKVYHSPLGFDFTYTLPLSKNFGFSINAVKFEQFNVAQRITRTFSTTTSASNPLKAGPANPYLLTGSYVTFPIAERRYNLGMRFDWRLSPIDKLSLVHSGSYFMQDIEAFTYTVTTGTNPVGWGADFTHGRTGSGRVTAANLARHYWVRNNVLRLNYSHLGATWDFGAGLGYGFSTKIFRAISHGQMETASTELANVTVDFDGYDRYLPGRITVRNAAGAVIDPYDFSNYTFFVNSPGAQTRDASATMKSARADATRKFFGETYKLSLKFGAAVKKEYADYRQSQLYLQYVGPDGRANSGDEGVARAPINLQNEAMIGFDAPRGMQLTPFASTRRAWEMYEQHPGVYAYPVANERSDIQLALTSPFEVTERIDAVYLMGDVSLLQNRLRVVGGVRYERTTDNGRGVLQDNNAKYQRDPAGNLVLDAQKRPILITTDTLEQTRLVYQRLAARMHKTYGAAYPSLNASYYVTPDTVARLGVARTLGRPDYTNLVGAANVTQLDFDPESGSTGSTLGTITAKNPGLKPWTADSLDLQLEHYTKGGGQVSVGFFRKQLTNFFANQKFLATADYLESISLSTDYIGYEVTAPLNLTDPVHVTGWEFNVNQPFSAFLPFDAARYFRGFANATLLRTKGPDMADLRGFSPKNINWGFTFNRRPITFVAKWYLVGQKRLAPTTATARGVEGWNYQLERFRMDASLEYQVSRHFSLYVSGRNIFNDRDQTESYGPGNPEYVRFATEGEYGVTYQFGIQGKF
ncbi:TonB-dependent receptor [Opitutus sp. ER46]|uniref:TonB-dependent receptor n=1 Tax=Opitutus sp. ER46 TaxID=2161864 RepID=UPI000D308207|nr:TonB-dependent receptor [Opitutus sp. ER46]PTX94342.1 hypothetical protein DB354_11325 [Opitutus sp. ER46]